MERTASIHLRQAGMVLLFSLVFLLLLSLIGLSSMQAVVAQQKMAASFWHRNQSLQSAESGLRFGEWSIRRSGVGLPPCTSPVTCAPPEEALTVMNAGTHPVSAITWVAIKGGLYGVQSLGAGVGIVHLPALTPAALYRVTAVGLNGQSRTVLESVYARVDGEGGSRFRRVSWRQLQ